MSDGDFPVRKRPRVVANADGTVGIYFVVSPEEARTMADSIGCGISALESEVAACSDNGDHDAAGSFSEDCRWLALLEATFEFASDCMKEEP